MKPATQVYRPAFDDAFFALPPKIQIQLEIKIQELGRQLETYPHHRLQRRREGRIRIADYRVFYTFDLARNILFLHEVGNRREVYRRTVGVSARRVRLRRGTGFPARAICFTAKSTLAKPTGWKARATLTASARVRGRCGHRVGVFLRVGGRDREAGGDRARRAIGEEPAAPFDEQPDERSTFNSRRLTLTFRNGSGKFCSLSVQR